MRLPLHINGANLPERILHPPSDAGTTRYIASCLSLVGGTIAVRGLGQMIGKGDWDDHWSAPRSPHQPPQNKLAFRGFLRRSRLITWYTGPTKCYMTWLTWVMRPQMLERMWLDRRNREKEAWLHHRHKQLLCYAIRSHDHARSCCLVAIVGCLLSSIARLISF